MKKIKFFILLGTVFSSTIACDSRASALRSAKLLREPSNVAKVTFDNQEYQDFKLKLKNFSNKFAEAYLSSAYEDGKNLTISPLSLEMCLGLAICASKGNTRQEILNALDMDYDTFKMYYKGFYCEFNNSIKSENNEPMFDITNTNSIWIDEDVSLLDSGLDELRDDYCCYSYNTDFGSDKAGKQISAFIEEKSNGLLKPDLEFSGNTIFVLMNTLYLKDIWNIEGIDLDYSSDPEHYFVNSNKQRSNKQLLKAYYRSGKTIETDNYSCFFAETSNNFKIYFVKPSEGKELKNVFNKDVMDYVLCNNFVKEDDVKKERYFTRSIFPEFSADCDADLKPILSNELNIKALFNPDKCDFSNVIKDPAYCDDARQIAKLEVTKKGIEGAAVTYMAANGTSAGPEPEYKNVYEDFVVNKEFGYILTYRDSVIFSGVITNIDK